MRIGIFDSGVGGLNLLCKLISIYPENHYFYYADNKNIPYGNKDYYFIKQNVFIAMDYFKQNNVDKVIIACNTVSTMLGELIKTKYDFIVETITPNITNVTKYDKSILFATNNTTIYLNNHLKSLSSQLGVSVKELNERLLIIPLHSLASLTEKYADKIYVNYPYIRYVTKYISTSVPIILGCTHYTFYQPYLESLGYTCFSELTNYICQELSSKRINFSSKIPFTKNLTLKLTDNTKYDKFFSVIQKLT